MAFVMTCFCVPARAAAMPNRPLFKIIIATLKPFPSPAKRKTITRATRQHFFSAHTFFASTDRNREDKALTSQDILFGYFHIFEVNLGCVRALDSHLFLWGTTGNAPKPSLDYEGSHFVLHFACFAVFTGHLKHRKIELLDDSKLPVTPRNFGIRTRALLFFLKPADSPNLAATNTCANTVNKSAVPPLLIHNFPPFKM